MFFKNLNQIKMKKIILSVCLYFQVANAQNNYGEFTYPHSNSSILSSGITSTVAGQAGFIMAGYNLNAAPYHFTIDRTNMGGALTPGSFVFQKEYNVYADLSGNCVPTNTIPVTSSHAVSIIQTPLSAIGARYALVGAFDEGCYLCFLDLAGSVVNTNIFWFPFPAGTNVSTITKPIIKEDPANLGNYFICGSYNNIMYALSIDYNGITSWSKLYPIDGQPNDMLVSGSDMVIVGQTTKINTVSDGFVINIGGLLGGLNFFNIYDYNNYFQRFSCITPAMGGNFVIGGECEIGPGVSKAYNIKVNGGGAKIWDNIIYSSADVNAGNFVGIVERLNLFALIEYYGVMTSSVGIIVSRMDANGVPYWNGPPVSSTSQLDEFVYNAPGVNLSATSISTIDPTFGYDLGLHIFGTDNNSGPSAPYLAQSYFSGNSGCNTPSFHFTTFDSICSMTPKPLNITTGLSVCNAIYIADAVYSSKVNYCGPFSSVANASNNRSSGITYFSSENNTKISVSVSPAQNQVTVDCINCGNISALFITSVLGQEIYSLSSEEISREAREKDRIICSDLSMQSGGYIVILHTEHGLITKKFMYQKE
jgi:hypothetical protein